MHRLISLMFVLGCSGHKDAPAPTGSAGAQGSDPWQGSGSSVLRLPAPPVLTFESAGSEPRRRVALSVATTKRSPEFLVSTEVNGERVLDVTLGITWTCEPGATCRYQLAKLEVEGQPPRDPAFETIIKATHGTVEVKADGTALIQPESLMTTTPSLTELLRLAIVRFPAEAIGVGAKWTIRESDLRRSYTVTALGATSIAVSFELEYNDAAGNTSLGTGTAVVGLDDPLARTLEATHRVQETTPPGPPPREQTVGITLR